MNTAVWHDRDRWLALLQELSDPATIEALDRVGVGPGWQALEVGAGRGSIAAWLAERVGPEGRAVATDVDTTLLDELDASGLEVMRHDVLADDFPAATFDLIHCRAVLVHLGEPDRALSRMAGWLKPGGVLVAEEPWAEIARLDPDPIVARCVEVLAREMDVSFARRLPAALREAGLESVRAGTDVWSYDGGTKRAAFFRRILEGACAQLVASGDLEAREVRRTLKRFDDPDVSGWAWPRVEVVGWKPDLSA